MEHFLFQSVRRELSHRDFSSTFAEMKPRWDSGDQFLIAPGSLRGTKVLGTRSSAKAWWVHIGFRRNS